jgi:hypothetical protein
MHQTHNQLNIFTLGGEAQRHRGLYEKLYILGLDNHLRDIKPMGDKMPLIFQIFLYAVGEY